MPIADLPNSRRDVQSSLGPQEIIRGAIVMMERARGKSSCRCQRGHKHRSMYISQSDKGKTRMIYVPKHAEAEVRRGLNNYAKLKKTMDEMSDANIAC